MSVNHESAFSGHLGAKKKEVRILPNFFWPGPRQEVIRLCRSCDVCQRTVKKGNVKKVQLGSMPLMNMPFKSYVIQHTVKLTDDTPMRCEPYPLMYAMNEELQNEVE